MKVFIYNRFLIVEITKLYHPRASMKDLGKRWFAFSRPDASGGWIFKGGAGTIEVAAQREKQQQSENGGIAMLRYPPLLEHSERKEGLASSSKNQRFAIMSTFIVRFPVR